MIIRAAPLAIALLITGCGQSTPQDDMPVRTWQYFVAHSGEIEPMQKICREWAGSNAPADTQPAVVATNCRAAAFAKSQLQLRK